MPIPTKIQEILDLEAMFLGLSNDANEIQSIKARTESQLFNIVKTAKKNTWDEKENFSAAERLWALFLLMKIPLQDEEVLKFIEACNKSSLLRENPLSPENITQLEKADNDNSNSAGSSSKDEYSPCAKALDALLKDIQLHEQRPENKWETNVERKYAFYRLEELDKIIKFYSSSSEVGEIADERSKLVQALKKLRRTLTQYKKLDDQSVMLEEKCQALLRKQEEYLLLKKHLSQSNEDEDFILHVEEIAKAIRNYSQDIIPELTLLLKNLEIGSVERDLTLYLFLFHLATSLQEDAPYRETLLTLFIEDPRFPRSFSVKLFSQLNPLSLPKTLLFSLLQIMDYYEIEKIEKNDLKRKNFFLPRHEIVTTLAPILIPASSLSETENPDEKIHYQPNNLSFFSANFLEKISKLFELDKSADFLLKVLAIQPYYEAAPKYDFEVFKMLMGALEKEFEKYSQEGEGQEIKTLPQHVIDGLLLLTIQFFEIISIHRFLDERLDVFIEYFENLHLKHPHFFDAFLDRLTQASSQNKDDQALKSSLACLMKLIKAELPEPPKKIKKRIIELTQKFIQGKFTSDELFNLLQNKKVLIYFYTPHYNIFKLFYSGSTTFHERFKSACPYVVDALELFSIDLLTLLRNNNVFLLYLKGFLRETIRYMKENPPPNKSPGEIEEEISYLRLPLDVIQNTLRPSFSAYSHDLFNTLASAIFNKEIEKLEIFFKQNPHLDISDVFFMRLFFIAAQMQPHEYREKLINLFLDQLKTHKVLPKIIPLLSLISEFKETISTSESSYEMNVSLLSQDNYPLPENPDLMSIQTFLDVNQKTALFDMNTPALLPLYTLWLVLTSPAHYISENLLNRALEIFEVEKFPAMLLNLSRVCHKPKNSFLENPLFKKFQYYNAAAINAIFSFLKSHITDTYNSASWAGIAVSLYLIAKKREKENPLFSSMLNFFKEELEKTYPEITQNWMQTTETSSDHFVYDTLSEFIKNKPQDEHIQQMNSRQRRKERKKEKEEKQMKLEKEKSLTSSNSNASSPNYSSSGEVSSSSASSSTPSTTRTLSLLPPKKLENEKPALTIYEACEKGNLDELIKLITPENLNQANEDGYTVLHLACRAGQENIMNYLSKQKNIDMSPDQARAEKLFPITPLFLLIENNHIISRKILHSFIDKITDWSLEPPYYYEYELPELVDKFKKWGKTESVRLENIKKLIVERRQKASQNKKPSAHPYPLTASSATRMHHS
ncbi:MAG: hypothetical protein ACD_44C00075G0001 [uncultured bacterium]|nr:MAG: hypothetical protein ACD_44C00075G0001 [uncultured bacterium]